MLKHATPANIHTEVTCSSLNNWEYISLVSLSLLFHVGSSFSPSDKRLLSMEADGAPSTPRASVSAPFYGYSKLWLHGSEESRSRRWSHWRSNRGPLAQKAAHQPTEPRLLLNYILFYIIILPLSDQTGCMSDQTLSQAWHTVTGLQEKIICRLVWSTSTERWSHQLNLSRCFHKYTHNKLSSGQVFWNLVQQRNEIHTYSTTKFWGK